MGENFNKLTKDSNKTEQLYKELLEYSVQKHINYLIDPQHRFFATRLVEWDKENTKLFKKVPKELEDKLFDACAECVAVNQPKDYEWRVNVYKDKLTSEDIDLN